MAQPRAEHSEAVLKGMIAKVRIRVEDLQHRREESLLLHSEHHPVLCEALQGAAVFVPSGASFCSGSKGSKKTWTSWGEPSWHKLASRRLVSEEPSKSLKIPYEQWNLTGFCPNSIATSAPGIRCLLLSSIGSLKFVYSMLEWKENCFKCSFLNIYIFLVNSVLMFAFGC